MAKKRILILVKTYPEMSRKYTETVCTVGIEAESRKLVRLYPIRYRYLKPENRFSKYQWIDADIEKAKNDSRPESFNIDPDSILPGDKIGAGKFWTERRSWVITPESVFNSIEDLKTAQTERGLSLGIVKPKKILGLKISQRDHSDFKEAVAKKDSIVKQLDFWEKKKDLLIPPYRFNLRFNCNNQDCTEHEMGILDWEFVELYRKVRNRRDWTGLIREKILEKVCAENRETYIILGNMVSRQHIFTILGFFWPMKNTQRNLFD